MLSFFIYTLEIILIALVSALIYRIVKLHGNETNTVDVKGSLKRLTQKGPSKSSQLYEQKIAALHQAQTFAGMQLLEIKRSFGDLHSQKLDWMREAISLYLIGAVDLIGKEAQCSKESRKELIYLVLRSNLKLSEKNSDNYFQEALYRKLSTDNDQMVRAGAKAAKSWLMSQNVPGNFSLRYQLDDWGVFA